MKVTTLTLYDRCYSDFLTTHRDIIPVWLDGKLNESDAAIQWLKNEILEEIASFEDAAIDCDLPDDVIRGIIKDINSTFDWLSDQGITEIEHDQIDEHDVGPAFWFYYQLAE